MIYYNGKSYP